MDLFQGSLPRKYISFRSGNSSTDGQTPKPNPQMASSSKPSEPPFRPIQLCPKQKSDDSDDTTDGELSEYASMMVAKLEKDQATSSAIAKSAESVPPTGEVVIEEPGNPISNEGAIISATNEQQIREDVIAGTNVPLIPHHVVVTTEGPNRNGLELEFPKSNTAVDVAQFCQEAQALLLNQSAPDPSTVTKVQSEGKVSESQQLDLSPNELDTGEESSVLDAPPLPKEKDVILYDTDTTACDPQMEVVNSAGEGTASVANLETPKSQHFRTVKQVLFQEDDDDTDYEMRPVVDPTEPRQLSGRSRSTLKRYFEETPPISLPVGHPTVAFSEPQLHYLIRVITDETIDTSFNLLRGVFKDAKGLSRPTSTPARSLHPRARGRSGTPHPDAARDTSEEDVSTVAPKPSKYVRGAINGPGDLSGSEFCLDTTTDEGETSVESPPE